MTFDIDTMLKLLYCRKSILEGRNKEGGYWPLIRKVERQIRKLEAAHV